MKLSSLQKVTAGLCVWAACSLTITTAQVADSTPRSFDIPPQAAETSLRQFSVQSGLEVLFAADAVSNIRTNRLRGEYVPAEGMRLLLRNTGLSAVQDERTRAFTVVRDNNTINENRNSPASTNAVPGAIRGRVIDADTGSFLPGATVSIPGAGMSGVSERDGRFLIRGVPSGQQVVNVRYVGYSSRSFTVSVPANGEVTLNATLEAGGEIFELEDFVVQGIVEGQARAIQQQRSATNIINVVSADAIGDFPDKNAAEALQRIAGVSLVRQRGEGRDVTIRGAAPNFNSFTIDGVPLLSNQTDGRTISMDVFAAEQLAGIEVTKSATPDMDGDSIGGAVNLRTKSAFDLGKRTISLNSFVQYNDLSEEYSYRGGMSFSDVVGPNDDWGVSFSLAYNQRKGEEDYLEPNNYNERTLGDVTAFLPNNINYHWLKIDRTRIGVSGALEKRIGDDDMWYLRTSYNRFVEKNDRPVMSVQLGTDFDSSKPVSATAGKFTRVSLTRVRGQKLVNPREFIDTATSVSTGYRLRSQDWSVDLDAWFSEGTNRQDAHQGRWRTGRNLPYTFDFSDDVFYSWTPDSDADNRDIQNPANYSFNRARYQDRRVNNDEFGFKADAEIRVDVMGRSVRVKTGLKARVSTKDRDVFRTDFTNLVDGASADMDDPQFEIIRVDDDFLGRYEFGTSVEPYGFRDFFEANRNIFILNEGSSTRDSTIEDYTIDEDIYAAYALADWRMGGLDVLAGVRIEHTGQDSTGTRQEDGEFIPSDESSAYTNFLPGVHLRYEVSPDFLLRFSWNNTLARPRTDFLAPNFSVDRPTDPSESDPVIVDGGNPDLEATTSMNFDLSAEYYLQSIGLVSIGAFYKDLDGPVYRSQTTGTFEGDPARITRFSNAGSAEILGLEFVYQQQFIFLPEPFDGFGIYANYTVVDSEVTLTEPGREGEVLPLFNQSDSVGNLALSYQKYGLTVRLARSWRGDYLRALGDPGTDLYASDFASYDLTASFKINDYITLRFEGNNLTNEPEEEYAGVESRGLVYGDTGRFFALGVTVTF